MPFSVETLSLSMAGDGGWQNEFSIPPETVPSSYLVLLVWREVFSARLQPAQRWMSPDSFIDQFLTLVYAKWFYFLGAFASVLPMHFDAAPTVTCPHVPQCCPGDCGGPHGCQHASTVYFGSCFL